MDVEGQCARRSALVEGNVVDNVKRSPFYPWRLAAHPLASGARRRAVEDALAVEMYRIIVGVGSLPVDFYGAHAHGASEVYLNFMRARYRRPAHVRRRLPAILQPVVAAIEYDAAFSEVAANVTTRDTLILGAQLDGGLRQPGVQAVSYTHLTLPTKA